MRHPEGAPALHGGESKQLGSPHCAQVWGEEMDPGLLPEVPLSSYKRILWDSSALTHPRLSCLIHKPFHR